MATPSTEATMAAKSMDSMCDLIAEAMRQPPEESRDMVEEMFRECEQQRPKLQEMAMAVIDQEGGDKIFNEITMTLDRLERLGEQKEHWVKGLAVGSERSGSVMAGSSSFGGGGEAGGGGGGGVGGVGGASGGAFFTTGARSFESDFAGAGGGAIGGGDGSWNLGGVGGGWPAAPTTQQAGMTMTTFPGASIGVHHEAAPSFGRSASGGAAAAVSAGVSAGPMGAGEVAGGGGGSGGLGGSWGFGVGGGANSSWNLGGSGNGWPSGQKATMTIQRPYKEVESDRQAFEQLFVSQVAKALRVPPGRIRVNAVRPGA